MASLIEVPVLNPRHLKLRPSYSRLETFSNCERRFLYDYFYPQPTTDAQRHGHRVHDQLERLVMDKELDAGDTILPQTIEGLKAWRQLDAKARATELWIDRIRDLPFSGKLDVVAEDARGDGFVVDWKTVKNVMNAKSQYEARRDLQLQSYCLALGCHRAVLVYLPFGGGSQIRDVTFTDAELEVAYRRLRYMITAVRSRWKAAGAESDGAGGILQPEKLDIEPFSVARPDYQWCKDKWCPYFSRCFGDQDSRGRT